MDAPVAIITGAGGGIGRASAIELAAMGYALVLVGRTVSTLEETRAALSGAAASAAMAAPADITQPQQVEAVVARAIEAFGRVDVLINNAGYAPVLSIEQTSIEQWHAVIDTNLSAAFYFAKAAWQHLKRSAQARAGGVIVNVSSAAARDPFPGFCAYAAAKAGINLLTLSLAREGAADGIRVHAIAPAATETAMFRGIMSVEQYPTEQTLSPRQVARAIAQCVRGDLECASGEVIYIHRGPA